MRKVLLTIALASATSFANDTTINATMQLMKQGMEQIQTGFMYNAKSEVIKGIETLENSNEIFKNVDVASFTNNNKVQVTNNINKKLASDLASFKNAVNAGQFSEATKLYGDVMHNCVSCHTIVRGW